MRAALSVPVLLAVPLQALAGSAAILHGPVDPPVPAPPFSLADADGSRLTLEAFRGRVVLVNFWATWCPPCRAEMPALQRPWLELHDRGSNLYGVNVDETPEDVRAFSDSLESPLAFPILYVLYDEDAVMLSDWGVIGLPTTFIPDRSGRIAHRVTGERDWDGPEFVDAIEALPGEG